VGLFFWYFWLRLWLVIRLVWRVLGLLVVCKRLETIRPRINVEESMNKLAEI
jgi:hypothetical protein